MSDDTAIGRMSMKHAYEQVTDAIAARIQAGRYPRKLPSQLHLAEEFGVSHVTVRHAIAILRERGLIVSIHGRGTSIASGSARKSTSLTGLLIEYRHALRDIASRHAKGKEPHRPA